jgi:hypothetical protein
MGHFVLALRYTSTEVCPMQVDLASTAQEYFSNRVITIYFRPHLLATSIQPCPS